MSDNFVHLLKWCKVKKNFHKFKIKKKSFKVFQTFKVSEISKSFSSPEKDLLEVVAVSLLLLLFRLLGRLFLMGAGGEVLC